MSKKLVWPGKLTGWMCKKGQPPCQEPIISISYLQSNQKKPDYQRLHQLLANQTPIRWLFAGDSITHGCMHTNYRRNFSELFEQYMRSNQPHGLGRWEDTVINTAASGATTRDLAAHFEPWVIQPGAQVAFLCFGMNDCRLKHMTHKEYRSHLERAVFWLRENGAIPILQTPNDSNRQKALVPYMKVVRDIAREQELLLIDLNDYWTKNTASLKKRMADKVHPNDAGHLTWFRFLTASLGILEESSPLAARQYSASFGSPPKAGPCEPILHSDSAQDYLGLALTGAQPVCWIFAGGTQTQGLTSNPDARNYVQHFKEVVGFELAAAGIGQCYKTMINSGRRGYSPREILHDYDHLIGRYQPDVVSVLAETRQETESSQELSVMEQDLKELVTRIQAQGGRVILQSPFAYGEQAQAVRDAVKAAAAATGCVFVDQTGLLAADLLKQPELKDILISNVGAVTDAGHLWLARYLTLTLVQPPAGSRIY